MLRYDKEEEKEEEDPLVVVASAYRIYDKYRERKEISICKRRLSSCSERDPLILMRDTSVFISLRINI